MLVNIRGGGLILINPSGWRGELRVKFFPTNYNTSIIHPKLWMSSESKHFTCSCLSSFKIKSFFFANSVESVSFKTHIINYTDTRRQYSPASCWLVFQNIDCSLSSAPYKPWIAVLHVIRWKINQNKMIWANFMFHPNSKTQVNSFHLN